MKKIIILKILTAIFVFLSVPGKSMADDPKARRIMEKVDARDDGDNMTFEMEMIQAVPRSEEIVKETGYKKSIGFVRKDNFYIVRAVHWSDKGDYLKYMDVVGLEQIEGVWVGTEIHMTTKKGNTMIHKTILKKTRLNSIRIWITAYSLSADLKRDFNIEDRAICFILSSYPFSSECCRRRSGVHG